MSEIGTSGAPAPPNARRIRRLRTACARCQRRKIRCDADAPSCAACAKAAAECVYEGTPPVYRRRQQSHDPSPVHNETSLAGRIRWLESVVRQEAPHFDLANASAGQSDPQALHEDSHSDIDGPANSAATSSAHGDSMASSSHHDVACGAVASTTPRLPVNNTITSPSTGSLSHEVGLVSLSAGADPKYVGPSSGYFLTQMLSAASRTTRARNDATNSAAHNVRVQRDRDLSMRVFNDAQYSLPKTKELTQQLSETFFHTVHLQYPFMHQPTHQRLIDQVYESAVNSVDDIAYFQVTMVLSISALITSRRSRVELPANGWCAAALARFNSVQVENSLEGLQSLLLLLVYAMHSPSSKFNAWFINYQCIAMVLDLGLQRDPGNAAPLSRHQREMRTRIFWVVYSLDRRLSTMMGRPIGLRDEACDLRLPADLDDFSLDQQGQPATRHSQPTHMTFAIHFFKLARINSEIKYVSHSVQRNTPAYAYPAIRDIIHWQDDVNRQLDEWASNIPANPGRDLQYTQTLCKIQYYTTKMLLLLPSPGIPAPRPECQRGCYKSSVGAIRLFNSLYAQDMLIYNWNTCHSVILHTFCLVYCVVALPSLAYETSLEGLTADLRAAFDILSATGEHWAGAKRSRDLLEDIAGRALQVMSEKRLGSQVTVSRQSRNDNPAHDTRGSVVTGDNDTPTTVHQGITNTAEDLLDATTISQEQFDHFYSTFFDGSSTFVENLDFVSHDFDISHLFTEAFDVSAMTDDA
ncbi:hypothetical protein K461DRAFT_266744 [Myriangium duriaei CBS 260.36]|uniref:Zn(2)-C6 fungal-type domain-containing protein n=1 Tax=Myriangium duriaei CBS 260.36 TaxID=1168546 RepID=A0A9P4MMR6_9PEZI|nr:hypothetical protein K461DRAFT_266744 [Myriangium duriaei CBS 260.36]